MLDMLSVNTQRHASITDSFLFTCGPLYLPNTAIKCYSSLELTSSFKIKDTGCINNLQLKKI